MRPNAPMTATSPEYLNYRWQEWQRDDPTAADRFLDSLYDQIEWETFNQRNLARYGLEPLADRLRTTLNLPPADNLPAPHRTRTPHLPPPLQPPWTRWSPEPLQEPTEEETQEHAQRMSDLPKGGLYHRGPVCRNCDHYCDHYDDTRTHHSPTGTKPSTHNSQPPADNIIDLKAWKGAR